MTWAVLTSAAGHELVARDELEALGISSYCPVSKYFTKPKRKSKPIESVRAAFPGYLFAQSEFIDFHATPLLRAARLRHLRLGEVFCTVHADEIDRMRLNDGIRSEIEVEIKFFVNDYVCVIDGPLVGMRGKVTEVRNQHCELAISGSSTKVTMPNFSLKKV